MSGNRFDFERIVPERRVERVRNQLHAAIYSGALRPGDPLREVDLCRSLGVSQVTVREALAGLEHIDLITRTPHRRTEVKNLTREELDERIAIRVPLETLACMLALENEWSANDFDELAKKAEAINKDPLVDLAFHRYIWCRSGNSTLLRLLLQVSSCLFGFVSIMRAAELQDPKQRVESHRKLIAALRVREKSVIEKAVRDHLDSAYERFREQGYPDFKSLADRLNKPRLTNVDMSDLVKLVQQPSY